MLFIAAMLILHVIVPIWIGVGIIAVAPRFPLPTRMNDKHESERLRRLVVNGLIVAAGAGTRKARPLEWIEVAVLPHWSSEDEVGGQELGLAAANDLLQDAPVQIAHLRGHQRSYGEYAQGIRNR